MSNSEKPKFAFSSKAETKEDITNSPVEETTIKDVEPTTVAPEVNEVEENLDAPYTDRRTVTIGLVRNYSLYRRVNDKALPNRRDFIGSSINSSATLSSNKTEIEAYFPALLGVAPNSPEFITRVKNYLNNIQVPIDELGKTFDCSFIYNTKRDYLNIIKKEEAIEEKYQAVSKNNLRLLKEARPRD